MKKLLMMGGVVTALSLTSCGFDSVEKHNKCVKAQNAMIDKINLTIRNDPATLPAAKKALAAAKAAKTACDKADQSDSQVKFAQYRIQVCLGDSKKAKEMYDKFSDTEKPHVSGAHLRAEEMTKLIDNGYKDGFTCGVVNKKPSYAPKGLEGLGRAIEGAENAIKNLGKNDKEKMKQTEENARKDLKHLLQGSGGGQE